jgi:hypothetical protein
MKTKSKKHGNEKYRGNRQKGSLVAVTAVVPRKVAQVINAEGMLLNKSVSKVVASILVSRYFKDDTLTIRKPL